MDEEYPSLWRGRTLQFMILMHYLQGRVFQKMNFQEAIHGSGKKDWYWHRHDHPYIRRMWRALGAVAQLVGRFGMVYYHGGSFRQNCKRETLCPC